MQYWHLSIDNGRNTSVIFNAVMLLTYERVSAECNIILESVKFVRLSIEFFSDTNSEKLVVNR
ncbi:hypothetical protein HBA_0193 [Sodalis endosymbiont of Henestaris halophilus]|nr:hypothetical protein HBA_0193 [Sodalis endosymbiont of Henestaris halophilus]